MSDLLSMGARVVEEELES